MSAAGRLDRFCTVMRNRSIRPVLHRHAEPESRRGELIVGCAADHIPKVIAALEYFGQRGARGRILQYLQLARRNSIRKIARRRECSLGARAPERNCEQKALRTGACGGDTLENSTWPVVCGTFPVYPDWAFPLIASRPPHPGHRPHRIYRPAESDSLGLNRRQMSEAAPRRR